MKNKKTKLIIIVAMIIIFMIIIASILFISNKNKEKKYYVDDIQNQFISVYEEENLKILDFIDIISFFGIDTGEIEEYTFMSNMTTQDEINKDMIFVVVINSDNASYYYDILYSYIESHLLHLEDTELLELFNNAIIKKGDNYTYMIIGSDAKMMEREINLFYKEI